MYKPNSTTAFLPITDLKKYCDKKDMFCSAIVFSPETENDHFDRCPPYIALTSSKNDKQYFFEVPKIVAYYATKHAGYTRAGIENARLTGRRSLADDLKNLIELE